MSLAFLIVRTRSVRSRVTLCLVAFALLNVLSHEGAAQSMPVGQITQKINDKKNPTNINLLPSSDEAARFSVFKTELDEAFLESDLPGDLADKLSNASDHAPNLNQAASIASHAARGDKMVAKAVKRAKNAAQKAVPPNCAEQPVDKNYTYSFFFPVVGCDPEAITSFFKVSGSVSAINSVRYLYNSGQSTNAVNADFFTATFPLGFQAILAATATAGSSQTAGSTQAVSSAASLPSAPRATGSTAGTGQTDSVDTAVAKLEQGGDFNLRFPFPIAYHVTDNYGFYALTSPSVGFNVSGLTDQNTITQSNEYSVNVPLEIYAQTASLPPSDSTSSSALLYVDLKPGMELVSPAMAKAIGLTSHRYFLLGQADAGIEFSGSVRVGFQYFWGPALAYSVASTSGTTTTRASTGGLHLVVSFTPKSGSKSGS